MRQVNVRYWHKADMILGVSDVCFWHKADLTISECRV
jgi:hypothetical protein